MMMTVEERVADYRKNVRNKTYAEATYWLNQYIRLAGDLLDSVRRLREENERLLEDAERYRYLRDYGSTSHLACRMFVTRYIGIATIPVYQGSALDAAVDAARGGK